MMRMLFIGVLLVTVLSACSSRAASLSIPVTASPGLPSTTTPPPEQARGIEYASVTEALASLKMRDGVSIQDLQGWIIATEADGMTTWCFAPTDHPAYPAVAKRVLYRDQDGWHLKMDIRCEAETAACDEFVSHFEALNEPIYRFIELQ